MNLTPAQFSAIFPRASLGLVPAMNQACAEFKITTRDRLTMFLANLAHESGGLTTFVENLNYSADGLANTWSSRYAVRQGSTYARDPKTRRCLPNALALSLHRRPEAIANNVYADRMGNGPESSGDGWKYRGRGAIQTTGKDNYRAASRNLNVDFLTYPEQMEQPLQALRSAAFYWASNGLNELADRQLFDRICEVVTGGSVARGNVNGLADRRASLAVAQRAIPVTA